jgi:hypothetical protein
MHPGLSGRSGQNSLPAVLRFRAARITAQSTVSATSERITPALPRRGAGAL